MKNNPLVPTPSRAGTFSKRKPHNLNAGYVCELVNRRTGVGPVVIYDRQRGFDFDADERYIIVCEEHHSGTTSPSLPRARLIMKAVDFCGECMSASLTTIGAFTEEQRT